MKNKEDLRDGAREVIDVAVPYALHRLALAIGRAKDAAFERDLGLSSAEWRILTTIAALAPLSTKALSDQSQLDKSTVSRTTTTLVHRGLIARKVDEEDQRLIVLTMTAAGRTACQAIVRSLHRWDGDLLEVLSARQLAALREVLDVLPGRLAELVERDRFRVPEAALS
jgi:DNA-binding MarR family transcriptional regulator